MLLTAIGLLCSCGPTIRLNMAPAEVETEARLMRPVGDRALFYFLNGATELQSSYEVFIDGRKVGTADAGTFLYTYVQPGKRVIRIVAAEWECENGPQMISSGSIGSRIWQWEEDAQQASRMGFEPVGPSVVPAACKTILANWISLKTRSLNSDEVDRRVRNMRLAYFNAESWQRVGGTVWQTHPDDCVSGKSTRTVQTFDQTKPRRPNDYTPSGFKDALCIFESN
ncbi:MAG: hypothetical protein ABI905_09445 [Betaproteobacteria bacterium]